MSRPRTVLAQFVMSVGVFLAVTRLSGVLLWVFVVAVLTFAGFLLWRGALRAR